MNDRDLFIALVLAAVSAGNHIDAVRIAQTVLLELSTAEEMR